jgi:hypothetical protein
MNLRRLQRLGPEFVALAERAVLTDGGETRSRAGHSVLCFGMATVGT